jgi:hypothetical protein
MLNATGSQPETEEGKQQQLNMITNLMAMAGIAGGVSAADINTANLSAVLETTNNHLGRLIIRLLKPSNIPKLKPLNKPKEPTINPPKNSGYDEIAQVFDKGKPNHTLTVNGKEVQSIESLGNKAGTTKVFDSKNLTDKEIFEYANGLSGGGLKPHSTLLGIYEAVLKDGSKVIFRNVSSSQAQTGARWTIEIKGQQAVNMGKDKIEIKFQ